LAESAPTLIYIFISFWELVLPGQKEITLSPVKGKRVLKDLVVDFEGHTEEDRKDGL